MKTSKIALRSTIFLLALSYPIFSLGVEAAPTPVIGGPGIYIDLSSGNRLLEEVEVCREVNEEISILRQLNDKNTQLDEIRKEREEMLKERIVFLEKQQAELLRMNDQAIKTADLARKAGGGAWYEQLFTAGKWIGLGILVGFVAGAAR